MEGYLIAIALLSASMVLLVVRQYIMKPYEEKIKLLESKNYLLSMAQNTRNPNI